MGVCKRSLEILLLLWSQTASQCSQKKPGVVLAFLGLSHLHQSLEITCALELMSNTWCWGRPLVLIILIWKFISVLLQFTLTKKDLKLYQKVGEFLEKICPKHWDQRDRWSKWKNWIFWYYACQTARTKVQMCHLLIYFAFFINKPSLFFSPSRNI